MATKTEIQTRQLEIWDLYLKGWKIPQIATKYDISYNTVSKDLLGMASQGGSMKVLSNKFQEGINYLFQKHQDRVQIHWSKMAELERLGKEGLIKPLSRIRLQKEILEVLMAEDDKLRRDLQAVGVFKPENNTFVQGDVNVHNTVTMELSEWHKNFAQEWRDEQRKAKELLQSDLSVRD